MTTQYLLPVQLIADIKKALIKLGYANAATSDGFIQDAYFKYVLIRQTGQNTNIPYAFDLLPKEIRDQLGGEEPTDPEVPVDPEEPGETQRILPRSLTTMPVYEEVKPVTGQIVFLSYEGYRDVKRVEYVNMGTVPPEQIDALLDMLPIRTSKPQVDYEAVVDFDSVNMVNVINFGSSAPYNPDYEDTRVNAEVYISYDIFAPYKDQYDAWGNPEGRDMETLFVDQKGRIIGKLSNINVFDETDPQVGFGHSSSTFHLPIDADVLEINFFIGASILNNTAYFTPTGQTPVFKIRATHPGYVAPEPTDPEEPEEPTDPEVPVDGELPMMLTSMPIFPTSELEAGQIQFLNEPTYKATMRNTYIGLGMPEQDVDNMIAGMSFDPAVSGLHYEAMIAFQGGANLVECFASVPFLTGKATPTLVFEVVIPEAALSQFYADYKAYVGTPSAEMMASLVDENGNKVGFDFDIAGFLGTPAILSTVGGAMSTLEIPTSSTGTEVKVFAKPDAATLARIGTPFTPSSPDPLFTIITLHPNA